MTWDLISSPTDDDMVKDAISAFVEECVKVSEAIETQITKEINNAKEKYNRKHKKKLKNT